MRFRGWSGWSEALKAGCHPDLGIPAMPIIKLSETITGIRGTIAGVTYSANRSGPYCKKWAHGTNPRTLEQSIMRGFPAAAAPIWNALSDEQREAWDDFALTPNELDYNSLGEQYFLSGYNWFLRAGIRRAIIDLAPSDTPPAGVAATAVTGLTVDAEFSLADEINVDWTDEQFEETDALILFAAMAQGQYRTQPPNNWRLVYATQDPGDGPVDIADAVVSFFGEPIENYRLFIRAWKQAEAGNRSTMTPASDYIH